MTFTRVAGAVAIAITILTGQTFAQHHEAHVRKTGLPHDVPDFAAKPTVRAARSGAWSAAGTWSTNRVPGAGDVVRIPSGITVTYDVVSDAALTSVVIDGTLVFRTDGPTKLVATVVEVMPSGTLEVGREGAPVAANVTAEIVIADQALDPKATTDARSGERQVRDRSHARDER